MRTLTLVFILVIVVSLNLPAQTITGTWNGLLKVQGIELRIIFNINKTDSGYSATMDSPDQGAKGIPVNITKFDDPVLKLEISSARIEYEGTLIKSNTEIMGTFKQGGQSLPLNLSREIIEKTKINRPQEPAKPYPYYSEDITFENKKDNITFAGTLTLPQKEGNFSVVILITGSGPQNRDEELLGHKPFLVIADHLTKNGIAVLRFDDRGTAKSRGDFKTATTEDFARDVESAIEYLKTRKEINKKKIGLIGHSEGGIIAPMVAAKSKDIRFIVLLAGTGINGGELLLLQQELIGRANGTSEADIKKMKVANKAAFEIIKKSANLEMIETGLTNYIKQEFKNHPHPQLPEDMTEDDIIKIQVEQVTSPWMLYFIKYDPATVLQKVHCPVLALNGEKDLQVPPKENLSAIKTALAKGKNKNVTIKEMPNMNHLFQECTTGSPSEYSEIEQTFSPVALDVMTNWVLKQVK